MRGQFGTGVARGPATAPDGQGQRQGPLIRQVRPQRRVTIQIAAQVLRQLLGHLLSAHALGAETGVDLANVLVLQRRQQRVARPLVLARGRDAQLLRGPAQRLAQMLQFAPRDRARQGWRITLGVARGGRAALGQVERLQRVGGRPDRDVDLAAACGVEAQSAQVQFRPRAEPPQQGRIAARQEMERRRGRVMRAAAQRQAAGRVRHHQGRPQRLQQQSATARRAQMETVVTRPRFAWREAQRLRVQFRALRARAADLGRGVDAAQMLPHQPGLGPPRPDAGHGERLARAHGQRQRRPQELAAALSGGPVDFYHFHTHPILFHSGPASKCRTASCRY